jgi:cytoskeletal protein CcmA (bactofilin family)
MRPGEVATVIGHSAKLRGELSCADDLQIEGEFEGTIRQTGGRLTIGAEARVYASIWATDVVVYGNVEGDIRASGRVDLRSSAVVNGDIFAGRLSMEEDATLHGQVDPSRAGEEEPALQENAGPQVVPVSQPQLFPVGAAEDSEPVLLDEREYSIPAATSVTQSGRVLPSALAAFAAGGRQDPNIDSAYRNAGSRAEEDAPWRNRASEE